MKINQKPCNPDNYTKTRKTKIQHIVIHYTGNDGDTAKNNATYFANGRRSASAHYFVDEKEIWQSVQDSDTAWHCGTTGAYKHKTCRNASSLGIEMCSRKNADGVFEIPPATVANAVQLVQKLMKAYSIPVENVLRHFDVTGNVCPAPFVYQIEQWTNFKMHLIEKIIEEEETMTQEKFNELMAAYEAEKAKKSASNWATADWEKAKAKGVFDGTMPQASLTREQAAAVLNRLGLLK